MTVVPTIQYINVRADSEHALYHITAQPYGLSDARPRTINLTQEQYRSFHQFLVTFRERLNTTTDPKETAQLYADALETLAEYHLIPRCNRLSEALHTQTTLKRSRLLAEAIDFNICALVTGNLNGRDNFYSPLFMFLELPAYVLSFLQLLFYGSYWEPFLLDAILWVLLSIMHLILDINARSTVSFLNNVEGPASGWIHSLGLTGIRQWNGTLTTKPHFFSTPLIVGFTGYKILDEQNETHFFIGACLYVKVHVI